MLIGFNVNNNGKIKIYGAKLTNKKKKGVSKSKKNILKFTENGGLRMLSDRINWSFI